MARVDIAQVIWKCGEFDASWRVAHSGIHLSVICRVTTYLESMENFGIQMGVGINRKDVSRGK